MSKFNLDGMDEERDNRHGMPLEMDEKKVKAGGSDGRLAIGAIRRKESGIECRAKVENQTSDKYRT